jgi:hypothetical protein
MVSSSSRCRRTRTPRLPAPPANAAMGDKGMHGVQKYVEVSSGRVGYALIADALSKASHGSRWKPDPLFNIADTILDNPEFVSVLRVVLRDGHVVVPAEGG